jgi:hypothetical protein
LYLCVDIPTLKGFPVLDRLKVTVQLKGLLNIPSLSQWYNRRGQMEPGPSTAATHQYLPICVMVSSQPNSQQDVCNVQFEFDSTCPSIRRSCCLVVFRILVTSHILVTLQSLFICMRMHEAWSFLLCSLGQSFDLLGLTM